MSSELQGQDPSARPKHKTMESPGNWEGAPKLGRDNTKPDELLMPGPGNPEVRGRAQRLRNEP